MKLLLTSGGVTNPSIHDALVGLLGKPIADSSALCIPTALYGHPWVGPGAKPWEFISGKSDHLVDLGWRSVGVLELSALPSMSAIPRSIVGRSAEVWPPLRAATPSTCATGCGSPGWRTCFRR